MALTISGTSNGKLGNLSLSASTGDILDSANTTFFAGDTWRISSNLTVTTANVDQDITANWERVDDSGAGYLGSGMSESSGVFTFPSTGIWLLHWCGGFTHSSTVDYAAMMLRITTDNSSYSANVTENYIAFAAGDYSSMCAFYIVDVTDTSNVKVKFEVRSSDSGTTMRGQTDESQTYAVFVRLGNT